MEQTTRLHRRNQNRKLRKAQSLEIEYLGLAEALSGSGLDLSYYRIQPQDAIYRVSGGTSPHILVVKPDGHEIHCNCRNSASPCSHVLRYRMFLGDAIAGRTA